MSTTQYFFYLSKCDPTKHVHLGWWHLRSSDFSDQSLHKTSPLYCVLHSPPIRRLLFCIQNIFVNEWHCHHLVPPPLLSGSLTCPDVLIAISLPKTILASLFSLFPSQKRDLLEEKNISSQNCFMTSRFILNKWEEPTPLLVLTYQSVPTSFTQLQTCGVYCFWRVPSVCSVLPTIAWLLEQGWLLSTIQHSAMSETSLRSWLRGRKYYWQIVCRPQRCCL